MCGVLFVASWSEEGVNENVSKGYTLQGNDFRAVRVSLGSPALLGFHWRGSIPPPNHPGKSHHGCVCCVSLALFILLFRGIYEYNQYYCFICEDCFAIRI